MKTPLSTGPMALICYGSGILYSACMALGVSGRMNSAFLLIGLIVAGFACGTFLGGLWLHKRFRYKGHTTTRHAVILALIYAVAASAMVLGFYYVELFALVGLVVTLFTAACLYGGARVLFRTRMFVSPLMYSIAGVTMVLAALAANAYLLYRLA